MKRIFLSTIAVCFSFGIADAQLIYDPTGKVGVGEAIILNSSLTVNARPLIFENTQSNIGIAASPRNITSGMSVGIEGTVTTLSAHTPEQNHGVRGVVDPYYNSSIGHNYGVTGIHSGLGNAGGAGVLGSSMFSTYYSGPNIQGKYAGYFCGNVYVSGDLAD